MSFSPSVVRQTCIRPSVEPKIINISINKKKSELSMTKNNLRTIYYETKEHIPQNTYFESGLNEASKGTFFVF